MRLTVTLDGDVAAGIKAEMERSRESFKTVVNTLMRAGFNVPEPGGGKSSGTKGGPRKSRKR